MVNGTRENYDEEGRYLSEWSPRSTIRLHGLLLYAYRHATGWKLLKAAYWPDCKGCKGWHTWALWGLTGVLLVMAFSPFYPIMAVARWAPFMVYVLMLFVYYPLFERSIRLGLSGDFARSGIVGEATQQPWRLRRTLLHYLWFADGVRQKINPSCKEIERCLAFIESNRKDKPPSWPSYFRHPLVVLIIGILVYVHNLKIADLISESFEDMYVVWWVFIYVLLLLIAGWFFYSVRYAGAEDDWRFERCVRWYLIDQQEDQKE
jgi:hypothetical protein